jgi:hypothetical protein
MAGMETWNVGAVSSAATGWTPSSSRIGRTPGAHRTTVRSATCLAMPRGGISGV